MPASLAWKSGRRRVAVPIRTDRTMSSRVPVIVIRVFPAVGPEAGYIRLIVGGTWVMTRVPATYRNSVGLLYAALLAAVSVPFLGSTL